jgi:hypothetical protein
MPELIGRQIELGLGVEKVRGTAQLTAEKWLKKITANIFAKVEKKDDESTMNVLEDSLGTRVTKKWIEGDLKGHVHVDAIGYLLYNIFGSVTPSTIATGVYQHIFAVQQSIVHPALTLFAKDGANSQEAFANGMVQSLKISVVTDDYVNFEAKFQAKSAIANSDTPGYDTEYDFVGKDVTVKFADTEAGIPGATATKVKELSISIEPGVLVDHILGQYEPDDIYNGALKVEGEFTLNYDDDTFKDLMTADSYKYMQIEITGVADIGTGHYPSLKFMLNRVAIKEWSREDNSAELVTQPIKFKAYFNATDGEMLTCTLQNNTSEYGTPISD